MCGVLVAPYSLPTAPFSSRNTGWPIDHAFTASTFSSRLAPCLPAPPLLIASQMAPFFCAFFAVSINEPTVCDFLTNGQPGLNHSRTTFLPLYDDSLTVFPSR